jgi:hypothetical protein
MGKKFIEGLIKFICGCLIILLVVLIATAIKGKFYTKDKKTSIIIDPWTVHKGQIYTNAIGIEFVKLTPEDIKGDVVSNIKKRVLSAGYKHFCYQPTIDWNANDIKVVMVSKNKLKIGTNTRAHNEWEIYSME